MVGLAAWLNTPDREVLLSLGAYLVTAVAIDHEKASEAKGAACAYPKCQKRYDSIFLPIADEEYFLPTEFAFLQARLNFRCG